MSFQPRYVIFNAEDNIAMSLMTNKTGSYRTVASQKLYTAVLPVLIKLQEHIMV